MSVHFVSYHFQSFIPPMQKLSLRVIPVLVSLGLSACSTFENTPVMHAMHRTIPQVVDVERTEFAPPYRYMRVVAGDHVVFMASDPIVDSPNTTSVWYSAEREVLRFRNGRLVAAIGTATEWRGVVVPELPSWPVLARTNEPFRWTRIRDVMPGYHYGVHDTLLLRRIPPPLDSLLKYIDPNALTWFEEEFDIQRTGVTTEFVLPRARYAVDLRDANGAVVYGEQCISVELCFSWQRWPVQAENKK